MQRFLVVYHEISHETLVFFGYTHEPFFEKTVLYYAIENTVANTINAAHDGKVGCNTVEYTTAFLYSDWLYFLGHGMKSSTTVQC